MPNTNLYRVQFHFEVAGRKVRTEQSAHVSASDNSPATLGAVLSSAGMGAPPGAVLVIDNVVNEAAGTALA